LVGVIGALDESGYSPLSAASRGFPFRGRCRRRWTDTLGCLEAVSVFGLYAGGVENLVDHLSALGVVANCPVVARACHWTKSGAYKPPLPSNDTASVSAGGSELQLSTAAEHMQLVVRRRRLLAGTHLFAISECHFFVGKHIKPK
jgi:hypothetical protein